MTNFVVTWVNSWIGIERVPRHVLAVAGALAAVGLVSHAAELRERRIVRDAEEIEEAYMRDMETFTSNVEALKLDIEKSRRPSRASSSDRDCPIDGQQLYRSPLRVNPLGVYYERVCAPERPAGYVPVHTPRSWLPPFQDRDGDGYTNQGGYDCDDSRSAVHPGARERGDGIDNNCNGVVDESCCDWQ